MLVSVGVCPRRASAIESGFLCRLITTSWIPCFARYWSVRRMRGRFRTDRADFDRSVVRGWSLAPRTAARIIAFPSSSLFQLPSEHHVPLSDPPIQAPSLLQGLVARGDVIGGGSSEPLTQRVDQFARALDLEEVSDRCFIEQ